MNDDKINYYASIVLADLQGNQDERLRGIVQEHIEEVIRVKIEESSQ